MQLKPTASKNLEIFLGEVLKQNSKHNLTGAKTKKDFEFHIEDCVQATIKTINTLESTVVDYGSGSGLLGVVIKILNPNKEVFLIERNLRKHQFQKYVLTKLGIKGITPIHEDVINFSLDKKYTVCTKAFATIKKTLLMTKNKENIKNYLFLKKNDGNTERELLEAKPLIYDYKMHRYLCQNVKMTVIEVNDN
jgi:16S rRNA (guanine527-N7)-methyltransferase